MVSEPLLQIIGEADVLISPVIDFTREDFIASLVLPEFLLQDML